MNLALLCYIEDVAQLEVPTLFLSDLISPVLSVIFAIILLDEIYSTAAPMMWTSVNRFAPEGTKRNKIVLAAFSVVLLAIVLSPLQYSQLLGIVYPYTGYIGHHLHHLRRGGASASSSITARRACPSRRLSSSSRSRGAERQTVTLYSRVTVTRYLRV